MDLFNVKNAKTIKGEKEGWLTGIIYMLPNTTLCPFADIAKCREACLVHAGYAKIYSNVNVGRLRRTELYANERQQFFNIAVREIEMLERKAKREGKKLAIRLNGTSDIMYERQGFNGFENIFEAFPHIQFYDYTKIVKRFTRPLPPNYDLTFSYSGTDEYKPYVEEANRINARMAVVFKGKMPTEFMGRKVIDGDKNDLRFLEPKDVIVGLKFKGSVPANQTKFYVEVK